MINTEYKDNQRFIHTFNKVFDEEMAIKIFKDGKSMWDRWVQYDKHLGKFVNSICVEDKIDLYNWVENTGSLELVLKADLKYNRHFEKKLKDNISEQLCNNMFGNSDVWNQWSKLDEQTIPNLLERINIRYKCKLFLLI